MLSRRLVALVALVVRASVVCAQPTQAEQAAAHYQKGQAAYEGARFEDALHEFELGYALAPRPEFLINFAQVHRKLGRHGDAVIDCERYLATSPPKALRDEVNRLLVVLREEQATKAASPSPAIAPPPPAPPPPAPPPPPSVASSPPHPHPSHRRAALIGGLVTGGVVLVGVAITLGVVFGRGPSYPDAAHSGDFR